MKLTIVGAGRVGSASVFSTLHFLEKIDKIVLVDVVENLAKGEALDLKHTASAMNKNIDIIGTKDYSETKNSDIVVITAGKARTPDISRDALLDANARIISSIAKEISKTSPKSIIIQVTNPLDALTYIAYKVSGFPRKRVLGMSSLLDTARLHSFGFEGMIIGQHGDTMVPTVEVNKIESIRKASLDVMKLKGYTMYAPAYCIAKMINAIANNTKDIIPCSCILDGEYGLKDIAIGVPAIIGRNGVEKIIELELNAKQKQMFEDSARTVKELIRRAAF